MTSVKGIAGHLYTLKVCLAMIALVANQQSSCCSTVGQKKRGEEKFVS
jgi:hypothetical protein